MKVCQECGALFLGTVEMVNPFDSRTRTFEPFSCHCTVDPDPEAPYSSGEPLRDLTEDERGYLYLWLMAYPKQHEDDHR